MFVLYIGPQNWKHQSKVAWVQSNLSSHLIPYVNFLEFLQLVRKIQFCCSSVPRPPSTELSLLGHRTLLAAATPGRGQRSSPQPLLTHSDSQPSSIVSKWCGLAPSEFNFSRLAAFLKFAVGYFCQLFGWVESTFENVGNITLPCRSYHPTHGPTPFHCWWLQGKTDFRPRQPESNASQKHRCKNQENHSTNTTVRVKSSALVHGSFRSDIYWKQDTGFHFTDT